MAGAARVLWGNWWLKLAALGLAYALWLGVARGPLVDVNLSVPLELRNLAPGLQVAGSLATRVQVHVRGPENLLRELQTSELGVVVDLQGYAAGQHQFPLTAANVEVPPGIEVVEIIPEQVRVELVPR